MPPPPGISTTSRSPGGTTARPFGFSSAPDFSDSRRPAPRRRHAAARRILHPLEPREDAEGGVLARADLHHLAQPAALASGATGILAQFLAPDHQWRDRLGRLHRNVAHTGGEWRRRQPVLLRPRARATRMEAVHHEWRAGRAADAGQPMTGDQVQRPEIRRALGRHAARQRLVEQPYTTSGSMCPITERA